MKWKTHLKHKKWNGNHMSLHYWILGCTEAINHGNSTSKTFLGPCWSDTWPLKEKLMEFGTACADARFGLSHVATRAVARVVDANGRRTRPKDTQDAPRAKETHGRIQWTTSGPRVHRQLSQSTLFVIAVPSIHSSLWLTSGPEHYKAWATSPHLKQAAQPSYSSLPVQIRSKSTHWPSTTSK